MTASSDDHDLLKSIASGDKRALEQLYALHGGRVHRFLERLMGNRAMAEEVVNEVFLAAWQGAGRYEGRAQPLTWLLSIAHNKAVTVQRKRRETTTPLHEGLGVADLADTPDIATQKRNKSEIMRACMMSLSAEHRTILDLVYYQERSISDAAEILAVPEGTVKTRMFHARKRLSQLLSERGIDRGWP